jgi:uncharacterized membrane protein
MSFVLAHFVGFYHVLFELVLAVIGVCGFLLLDEGSDIYGA